MTPDRYTIKEQMLAVGSGHNLYIHEWGNKSAKQAFLFLHGGPGSGCSDGNKAIFDGSRDKVIFFDQRGAGRSTPHGALRANTTAELVEDIVRVLRAVRLDTVTIVGVSWGSCLALAFTLAHPSHVSALALRGIFTGSQREVDYLMKGQFQNYYPDAYERLQESVPEKYRTAPMSYLAERLLRTRGTARGAAGYDFTMCIRAISSLDNHSVQEDKATFDASSVRIQARYIRNHCFMPDRYILRNAHKIHAPVYLVQGRYDMLCPPVTAFELHRQLSDSRLILTTAGHRGDDRANFEAQRAIINDIATHSNKKREA